MAREGRNSVPHMFMVLNGDKAVLNARAVVNDDEFRYLVEVRRYRNVHLFRPGIRKLRLTFHTLWLRPLPYLDHQFKDLLKKLLKYDVQEIDSFDPKNALVYQLGTRITAE